MIEVNEILQTMQMIHEQHFDIRTITMGISLLDCKKNTDAETAECVFEKVTRCAGRLVAVGEMLMESIKRSKGRDNKSLARFAEQLRQLLEKWEA